MKFTLKFTPLFVLTILFISACKPEAKPPENNDGNDTSNTVDTFDTTETVEVRLLNDTGLALCGDYAYPETTHNNDVDCDLTDEVANGNDPVPAGQDGHYGRDSDASTNSNDDGRVGFQFTKLDAVSGGALVASAIEWGCVLDEVTGLTWEVKDTAGTLRDSASLYTWYNSTGSNDGTTFFPNGNVNGDGTGQPDTATGVGSDTCLDDTRCDSEKFVADVNALAQPLCGFTDWRLPTISELVSIIDFGATSAPLIDSDFFPNTLDEEYWSSTPSKNFVGQAWRVYVDNYWVGAEEKSRSNAVRLVRSGE